MFGPVTAQLVEYGIAHLCRGREGQIVEPLAFLSLMRWLQSQDHTNLKANIRLQLDSQSSRGTAYEELIILYLLRTLRYPVPFSTIFNFHGTPPIWVDEMAQIVGRLNRTDLAVDVLGEAPQNLGLPVVHYAANVEDVLDWIETSAVAPAVLITSHLFGPDVMVRCRSSPLKSTVASRNILLIGQFKLYMDGNKESLDMGTISHALTSLNQDHWFKQMVCELALLLSSAH